MSYSKFECFFNQERKLAPNQSEKYSRSISNAYYTLAASANRKRKRIPSKLIRVYTASKMSSGNSQLGPFSEGLFIYSFIIVYVVMSIFFGCSRPATKMLRLKEKGYQIEYLTVADIRERFISWSHPSFLVDWLLDSDYHFILCQGIHSQMFGIWSPSDCIQELKRLEFHNGFPSGINLCDPVFNGDKFDYLCALSEYCNPSFKIPLDLMITQSKKDDILDRAKEFINRFIKYDGDLQKGFIMKAPFVQNKQGFPLYHFTTFEQLVTKINSCYVKESTAFGKLHLKDADVFPYLIIQPRMVSNAESKVVLWNGVAQYVCITPGRIGILKKKEYNISKSDLFKYTEDACATLKQETNGAFNSDGLTRVDCFCLSNGKIVVNEVESLDANFSGRSDSESLTSTFLVNYYCKVMEKLF